MQTGTGNNEFSWSGPMLCLSMSSPIPTAKWGFDKMGRPGPNAYVKGQKHIKFPLTHRASLRGNP